MCTKNVLKELGSAIVAIIPAGIIFLMGFYAIIQLMHYFQGLLSFLIFMIGATLVIALYFITYYAILFRAERLKCFATSW